MLRIRVFFAWYDMWVGAYWDRKKRILYVCPIPCLCIEIHCGKGADNVEIPPLGDTKWECVVFYHDDGKEESEEQLRAEIEKVHARLLCSRTPDMKERRAQYERDPRSVDRYWLGWDDALTEAAADILGEADDIEIPPLGDVKPVFEKYELVIEVVSLTNEYCTVNATVEADGKTIIQYGPYTLRKRDTLRVSDVKIEVE